MKEFLWWIIRRIWSPGLAGLAGFFGMFYMPALTMRIFGNKQLGVILSGLSIIFGLLIFGGFVIIAQRFFLRLIGRPDLFDDTHNPSAIDHSYYDNNDGLG